MSETGTTNTTTTGGTTITTDNGTSGNTATGTTTTDPTVTPAIRPQIAVSTNVTAPVLAGAIILPCSDTAHSTVRFGDAVWGPNIASSTTVIQVGETGEVQISTPTLGPIDTDAMITFARDLPG